ncbi:MAG: hypothetical protein ACI3XG_10770 [Faecousia sp.]
MAILKCKYCGGNVSAFPDNALGTCSRCGATMTLPRGNQNAAAHNCGNYLRRAGKFDQALAVYQKLLQEDETDAESHWCSALCRFGVQYVLEEDSGEYLPTVARPEGGSFLESGEYLAALANSGGAVQLQYEKEAARIAGRMGQEAPSSQTGAPPLLLKQGFWHLEQKEWSRAERCLEQVLSAEPENAMAHLGLLLAEFRCPDPKALTACRQDISKSAHYGAALEAADENLSKFLQTCAHQIRRRSQLAQIEAAYQSASEAMEAASTNEAYRQAARLFSQLDGYKDSQANAKECLRRAEILRRESIYRTALTAKARGQAAQAAALFAKIPGWRDANVQAVECRQRAAAMDAAKPKKEPETGMWKKIVVSVFLLALLCVGGYLTVTRYVIPKQKYDAAEALLEAGRREEAIEAFQALGSFQDSPDRVLGIQIDWYNQAEQLLSAGDTCRAAAAFGGLRDFQDARERSRALWETIVTPQTLSAGGWYTAALRSDGTANAVGDDRDEQCWVGSWLNIRSISAGWEHTVGLRTDGTVVAAGYNGDGRGDTEQWRDMVDVSAGQWHTVGLKSNGTVIGLGCDNDGRIDFEGWQEIKSISAGRNHTVGLKADGTALAVGDNRDGQCNIQDWNRLTAVSAGGAHTLGLKQDGTVAAAGSNEDGQCNVTNWTGITAVSAGYYHSVGLKSDGTVVAVGFNEDGQCDVADWTDIVAVSAGGWHTLGLKSDGSIVATGRNENGQCEILGWDNMMLPG